MSTGPTTAKVAGEEEKGKNDGNNPDNRENSGHCAFVVKETREKTPSVPVLGKLLIFCVVVKLEIVNPNNGKLRHLP